MNQQHPSRDVARITCAGYNKSTYAESTRQIDARTEKILNSKRVAPASPLVYTLALYFSMGLAPMADGASGGNLATYVDIRGGAQAGSLPGSENGVKSFGSRLGARWVSGFPGTSSPDLSLLAHAEFGLQEKGVGLNGTRLLKAGIAHSGFGSLTYGRHRGAFYSVLGPTLTRGFELSGFGYIGPRRLGRSLEYAYHNPVGFLIADVANDHHKEGRGLNRYQLGAQYRSAHLRLGLALDSSREHSVAKASVPRKKECDLQGVSCAGAIVEWSIDGLSIAAGVIQSFSAPPRRTAMSVVARWAPNQFTYYLESSKITGDGYRKRALAFGVRYEMTRNFSGFMELARVQERTDSTDTENAIAVGIQFEYDAYH